MRTLNNIDRNHLLASLFDAGCERLRSHLELLPLAFGDVLYEADSKLVHVYFPTTSVVSLLSVMEDGASDEIAFVGNEGIVGVPLFLGAARSPHRVVVRSSGYAYRLNEQLLLEEFNRSGAMHNLLLRYTEALLAQISQAIACHRHHSIHQQFCRWLLSSVDRLPSDELCLTQESIALMLGVRRETISKEVAVLQAAGLIQNRRRGRIVVIDRPKLEARACECYRGMKGELGRLTRPGAAANRAPVFYRENLRAPARYAPAPRAAGSAQVAATVAP
jgi:CRP-like cAMP-binding protein